MPRLERLFAIGVALNLAFVVVEIAVGVWADSLAVLSDAAHNVVDVLGLLLAWAAIWLARRKPSARRTYGLGRTTIYASLANALILMVGAGAITWEAILRFSAPAPVAGAAVMAVAAAGIVVNGATAWLFHARSRGDINVRGAFLHMLADAAVSAGVLVTGFLILQGGWLWLDPAMSLVVVAVIIGTTFGLLRESLQLAVDGVPTRVDRAAVEAYLAGLPGVREVHDLHIWALSTTGTALTAHLVRPDAQLDDAFLSKVCGELEARFGINHATIQVEHGDGACRLAPAEII